MSVLRVRIILKGGRKHLARKHRERRDRTAVALVSRRIRIGDHNRPRTGVARMIIVRRGMRILELMTTVEATGTIVRRIPTGSKRQPHRRLTCKIVCGI